MRVMFHPESLGSAGNPYVDHLVAGLRAADVDLVPFHRRNMAHVDVVHLNWPAFLIDWSSRRRAVSDIVRTVACLRIARARGVRIVWTAHDLGGHDRRYPAIQRAYERAVAACADDVVSMTRAGVPALRAHFPELARTRIHVVPHGHYRDDYPTAPSREDARRELGLPLQGRLILQFGQLRRYKAIHEMIAAFGRLDDPETTLLVVGESKDPVYTRELAEAAARTPRVQLRAERVDERTAGLLLTACDVVYAAYPGGTALNSGVAVLGVSFGRPVIVRDTPVMGELAELVGERWVHRAAPGEDVAALHTALEAAQSAGPAPDLSALDWDAIVARTLEVYRGDATALEA